ncbi:type II secretion system F family protein [Pseudomonas aeruginosa]
MNRKDFFTKLRFTASVRKNLYQSFVDYLGQGIPLNEVVSTLSKAIVKANAKSQMFQVRILDDIESQMAAGVLFEEAMAKWAPINEVMSIRAGMRSGDPVRGMINTIEALEASSEMITTILKKLSYPAILLTAMAALIFFFSVSIIPQIANVMDPELWPDSAKKLYNLAHFVQNFWWAVVLILIGTGALIAYSLPRLTGPHRRILDKFPPYSFYRAFHGANLLISIAALMRSGVPFVNALKELQLLSSAYLNSHLEKMISNMDDGCSLGESLDTGLLSGDTMVSVYMMSGNANFQSAISEIGKISVRKGIATISAIAGALNGAAILGVTCYIGWVYYAFYTVSNAMSKMVG